MSTASSQPQSPPVRQVSQAQRTAEAKAAFTASLNSVGSTLDRDLKLRAQNIHENSKALGKQEKDVQNDTKKLSKQNDAMEKAVDKMKSDMREFDDLDMDGELGDLMASLNKDMDVIEETLRIAEEDALSDTTRGEAESHQAEAIVPK